MKCMNALVLRSKEAGHVSSVNECTCTTIVSSVNECTCTTIVIINEQQIRWAETYGRGLIICDDTYNAIKTRVPSFAPTTLMTDDSNVFFNSYNIAFPQEPIDKRLCSWHITRSKRES
ncbi:hypothetical protein PRIPAC_82143 [Pristionchus pacificus]|uniref:Uncharacterized protein n=1 Tax=Pristionchus pacificus TaxID=54126 RepID=A0A2A6BWR7_PRIPA|nr:hypothetical protein PRIPAC_82143 [Pristionchus pacificus]|eukprot:PDM70286.1 hypothetical protein PRIPAC_46532 [Pristionchus pacificus]